MSVHVRSDPARNGGHEICSDSVGSFVVLVRVRPVGTLEWGDLPMFATSWVPEIIQALRMAQHIGDTRKVPEGVETGHDMGLTHACETFPQFKGKL